MQKMSAGKFHSEPPSLKRGRRDALFRLDVRRLDDRPPLLDFGLVKGAERLWRLLLAGKNLVPQIGKPGAHGGIRKCLNDRSIELGDYVGGRALGRPQTMPKRRIERGSSRFVDGWNLGGGCPARAGQYRIGFDLAAAQMGHDVRALRSGQIDLPGNHVLDE